MLKGISFKEASDGELAFGVVKGWLDVRCGGARADFSWEGQSDVDLACGRGRVALGTAGRLIGRICIHCSDDSGFVAEPR